MFSDEAHGFGLVVTRRTTLLGFFDEIEGPPFVKPTPAALPYRQAVHVHGKVADVPGVVAVMFVWL